MEARVGIELLRYIENTQVIDSECATSVSSSSTPKALAQILIGIAAVAMFGL